MGWNQQFLFLPLHLLTWLSSCVVSMEWFAIFCAKSLFRRAVRGSFDQNLREFSFSCVFFTFETNFKTPDQEDTKGSS